ncbi:aspartyl/asparaginyl beta-hydroxylase isoform X2 [Spodoptera frugiperda]|uniref:Aspartyl/asparaginyl beta-hydroxylase isoform X2 n=1 Tax=Spodoptera frugiperda TaxID=7108 RepID=A0A9R0DXP8_SPOFR|nr:aspartyl/asparaginyl beta-hydroxylase isoform X2 [Spodoptera frugiperda]
MSGDVQPRKRKDKKRKKDELGVDEGPRGTAAALGEGDVFMHSPNDHGTGGHWCAKIIFFSLLAVLVTLIGLIILENRGLSELEANSVESRYSGVLEGWLEDAPDDDHHDEHTLELKHHDDDDDEDHDDHDDQSQEIDHDDEDDEGHDDDEEDDGHDDDEEDEDGHDDDDEDDGHEDDDEEGHDNDDDDDNTREDEDEDDQKVAESNEDDDDDHDVADRDADNDDDDDNDGDDHPADDDDDDDNDDDQQDEDSAEQDLDKSNEDENDVKGNIEESGEDGNDDDDNDDLQNVDENDTAEDDDDDQNDDRNDSLENDDADDDQSNENEQDDKESRENEDDDEHEEEEDDLGVEVERLEKEVSDEDALSEESPAADAEDDDKDDEASKEVASEDDEGADDDGDDDDVAEDEEFLEPADIEEDLPVVEQIVAPKGKPLVEVEEEPSTAKPVDTLAEEEEYEKQQEELRKEQEQASHMWLKLVVGGALLVATHAVVRRATAPRDDAPASDEHGSREETPVIDRRMTLIAEEAAAAAVPSEVVEEIEVPVEKIIEKVSSVLKAPPKQESEEEEVEEEEENEEEVEEPKDVVEKESTKDKELYSDEEVEEEEEEEKEVEVEQKNVKTVGTDPPKQIVATPWKEPEPEADEEVPDDVEIIDDEQLEEELEEEDEEEEISDVDDAELLSRLEAKYGRLPEPERPGQKHKDGGNSIEDDWPGEPADQYWRQQLDQAEEELRQGEWSAASRRAGAAQLAGSARARWLLARAVDAEAEARRDNRLLTRAITAYLDLLKMNERLTDHKLLQVAHRTLDRIRFRGNYLSAEPVYRLLIRRFPDVPGYYNNLTISFLMANRADLAEQVLKDTLKKWPDDRVALAHHGFVLKTQHNRLEEAVEAFQKALQNDTGPATESRFYYHLGDSLLLLGRYEEAHEVHKRGAAMGHFLSPSQRSLYNVERLKSRPWWNIEQTPYTKLARALEKSWKEILKEGEAAKALYEKEKEGLKERGEWSQLDLFVRGQEIPNRCKRAPVTCSIVRSEVAASGCRRGQIKFSAMEAGTHVRPHVGPTNCRLRMHLGLSNTKDTYLRVDKETRQWQVGKTFMFDDSFEHEVWHNGTGTRLVLIVDVWHPDLTPAERRSLPPI